MIETTEKIYPIVKAVGGDYSYHGRITSVFRKKRGGHIRCVIEDDNGRLFIHSAKQLNMTDESLLELGVKFKLIVA